MKKSSAISPPHILIAEDANNISRILIDAGYQIINSNDGEDILNTIKNRPCALVICNTRLPLVDGFELCRIIKNDNLLFHIPFILVTEETDPDVVVKSLNVGADSLLITPIIEKQLLERVQSLLNKPAHGKRLDERLVEQVAYNGKIHSITADLWQSLNLLLSLHEHSLSQNRALIKIQSQLDLSNKESEEKLRGLYELSPLGIALTDMNGHYIEFNDSFCRICGYSEDELKVLDYWKLTPRKYQAEEMYQLESLSKTGHYGPYEKEYLRKDGTLIPLCLNGLIVTGQDGQKYIWSIVEDITERRRAEALVNERAELALHASLTKYQILFESSRDALMMVDPNSLKFTEANQATLNMFRVASISEFSKLGPLDVSPHQQPDGQQSGPKAQKIIEDVIQEGSHFFEWVHMRADGQPFVADVMLTRMRDAGKLFLLATVRDITERKQIEETLRRDRDEQAQLVRKLEEAHDHLLQSDKMASIGQLAAGVAHEINNPIGYVSSNLGSLEQYVDDAFGLLSLYEQAESSITDSGVREKINAAKKKVDIDFLKKDLHELMIESKDGITRVKNIVQNLKDFAHVDISEQWQICNLHKGLDSTLNVVNNEIKYKAELIKQYGDIPDVECLSSQINQVFMNLLVNAAHAIQERGVITIKTVVLGDEVCVSFADTGSGIAPEHLTKIFDPFFTTKPLGKGTGLGLSLSYNIIKKHHGRIEVQSELGKGTTFQVWLPISQPHDGTE